MRPRSGPFACAALLLAACAPAGYGTRIVLPAERNAYARPSSSDEIAASLAAIATAHPGVAAVVPIGQSALGRPLQALLLSRDLDALQRGERAADRLTVLLVGSQHGNEPSGGEALLHLALEIAGGSRRDALDAFDLIVVPNGNPDGRDVRRRGNGNGVNLSTNYVALTEPESRAVADALRRWRPDVVLDVHESAIFKPSTLARQGYLTDFEAQLGTANNANLDPALAAFSRTLLADTLARIRADGLPASEYIGEITDVHQPITHGGLSARNLRNAAGLRGAFSFLLENRLDPKHGTYPTPRNLRARIAKQRTCIHAVLAACGAQRDEILRLAAAARHADPPGADAGTQPPLWLISRYGLDPGRPTIDLRLRRLDGTAEVRRFAYHGVGLAEQPLPPPRAYAVVAHQSELQALLERHRLHAHVLASPRRVDAVTQRIEARERITPRFGFGWSEYELTERRGEVELPAGTLWIPLDQPGGRLIPSLLDPRSTSSIFEEPPYDGWVEPRSDFFVLRIEMEGAASSAPRSSFSPSAAATKRRPPP